ncbi:exosporium protein CsxB [Clostridium sp. Marseille-Q2269]|uniref:exosporium protein CsxB n=1 Tax=Clostridium sp. Marseille-Q2269 TaxID=2942205 RepID=UPI002074547D|nr:exosporium protein CsxB [Clostridium sp. Marseille-Q2269]
MSKSSEEKMVNKEALDVNTFTISEFCNAEQGSNCIHFKPCEICKRTVTDPINVADTSRLLQVNVVLRNVCIGKELTVGCIIIDDSNNVLAFRSQTFTVSGHGGCGCSDETSSPCTNVNRRFSFILPTRDLCSSMNVRVRIIANYTNPC